MQQLELESHYFKLRHKRWRSWKNNKSVWHIVYYVIEFYEVDGSPRTRQHGPYPSNDIATRECARMNNGLQ